jgi:hypothetical protein
MLLSARNWNEPTLSARNPQLISGSEVSWRIVEGSDADLNFVGAIDNSEH